MTDLDPRPSDGPSVPDTGVPLRRAVGPCPVRPTG